MNKSETIGSIAKALANFQAEIKNPKQTATNPYFRSKYAPLAEILDGCRPVLAKHGISVIQSNGGNGENITVTTLLLHSSGVLLWLGVLNPVAWVVGWVTVFVRQ